MHTLDEIAEAPPYREAVREICRVGTLSLGMMSLHFSPQRVPGLPARHALLALFEGTARIRQVCNNRDRPVRTFTSGDMIVRPPCVENVCEGLDPFGATVFELETDVIRNATTAFTADVDQVFARMEARPFRAPLLSSLAKQLMACARAGGDRLYADALSFAMIHEVWRVAEGEVDPRERNPGALGGHTLRRIDEAIDGAEGDHLSLDRLSQLAEMTQVAFSAAMKASTGQTPYQYVLSRRIERARSLIEATPLPLCQVAFRCGFSSQSHMTDVFRRK
ncbi:MAG: AraC family transcriptional regulator, partial [Pseudomonadota bacterium]